MQLLHYNDNNDNWAHCKMEALTIIIMMALKADLIKLPPSFSLCKLSGYVHGTVHSLCTTFLLFTKSLLLFLSPPFSIFSWVLSIITTYRHFSFRFIFLPLHFLECSSYNYRLRLCSFSVIRDTICADGFSFHSSH